MDLDEFQRTLYRLTSTLSSSLSHCVYNHAELCWKAYCLKLETEESNKNDMMFATGFRASLDLEDVEKVNYSVDNHADVREFYVVCG